MRAASAAGYLSLLAILTLSLAACGGGDPTNESEEAGSSTIAPLIAELTTSADETTTSSSSSNAGESFDVASSEGTGEPVASLTGCQSTQPDMLGLYYVPDAPVRTSVDTGGYVTSGEALSADTCESIPGAKIEFWLADPEGNYDEVHRATVLAGEGSEYSFESNFPGLYESRPPHIHVRVTAPGYEELVTQHYPEAGQRGAVFDLVLQPAA